MIRRTRVMLATIILAGCSAGNAKDDPGIGLAPGDGGLGADVGGGGGGFDASDPDAVYSPDGACASRSFDGRKLPLAIALVFDQSSSMSSGGRIGIAKAGIEKAFADPKTDDVAVGLFRFGYIDGLSGCTSDTTPTFAPQPLATGRTALFAAIEKLEASGATPTFGALSDAYAWLKPKVASKAAPYDGKVAVVLVTDGAPTCGSHTPDDFFTLVSGAHASGIDTFIIGLPGSGEPFYKDSGGPPGDVPDTTAVLSKMAASGTDAKNLPAGCQTDPPLTSKVSKPCYYDLESSGFSATALAAALDGIRKASSSCEYAMPAASPLYDFDHPSVVVVDGKGAPHAIPQCTTGSPPAGGCWEWIDATKTRVRLVGGACTLVTSDDAARVDLLLACKVR